MHRTQFDHSCLDLLSRAIWSRVLWGGRQVKALHIPPPPPPPFSFWGSVIRDAKRSRFETNSNIIQPTKLLNVQSISVILTHILRGYFVWFYFLQNGYSNNDDMPSASCFHSLDVWIPPSNASSDATVLKLLLCLLSFLQTKQQLVQH